jgi:hypothetical protein
MPSFGDPGCRSGYALNYFCRARLLADLLIDTGSLPAFFAERMEELFRPEDGVTKSCRIASIGGGPGYDFVSAALVATFIANSSSGGGQATKIHGTVFDYEEGWHDLVPAMSRATCTVLELESHPQTSFCDWGGKCDITR